MANEMQGTYWHHGDAFPYRATYEVNLAEQSIAIDCTFETHGTQRQLNICVFASTPDLEQSAPHIAGRRIEAHIDRVVSA
jgi:hypothetical protein